MTHDPKIDDEALNVFLHSNSEYIGALGSRKSHAARLKRLGKLGFKNDSLSRIHAPIGIDIGSETPAEIALSVMAEIVKKSHQKHSAIR
jgi:xanthine dehydrogenase accessory factor